MVENGEKEGWKECKVGQGGVAMVENGARRGGNGAKWDKERQQWCKME